MAEKAKRKKKTTEDDVDTNFASNIGNETSADQRDLPSFNADVLQIPTNGESA